MVDADARLPFVAISSLGRVVAIPGPLALNATGLTRQQEFNVLVGIASDDDGRTPRTPLNFPDGHFASPFLTETWEVISRDEYELRAPPSDQQKQRWADLRAEDTARRELYAKRSAEWCESLGRYVVHYEAMSTALLRLARALLAKGGLSSEKAADIVLADQTTRPLSDVWAALMRSLIDMSDDDRRIESSIFKRVNACIEVRNFLLHSAWYFGGVQPTSSGQFSIASAQKFRKSKEDPTRRSINFTREALGAFSDRCVDARTLVTDLCRLVDRGGSLSSYLKLNGGEALERALRFERSFGGTTVEHYPPLSDYQLPRDQANTPLDSDGPGYDVASIRELSIKELISLMGIRPKS